MTDKLIGIFADELMVDAAQLDDESSPDNTLAWDSMAAMRLVAALEEAFSVRFSTAEIMKMKTIGIARSVLASKGVSV